MKQALILIAALAMLTSCKTIGDKSTLQQPASSADLKLSDAQERKSRLSDVRYKLDIKLTGGKSDKILVAKAKSPLTSRGNLNLSVWISSRARFPK